MANQKTRQEIIDQLTQCGNLSYQNMIDLLYSIFFLTDGTSPDAYISKLVGRWSQIDANKGKYDIDYFVSYNERIYRSTVNNNVSVPNSPNNLTWVMQSEKLQASFGFKGKAVTGTNPGVPTAPEFWLGEPGVYSNFGGQTITGASGFLIYNAGTWSVANINIDLSAYKAKVDPEFIIYETVAAANLAITNTLVNGINKRDGKIVNIGTLGNYTTYWWKGGFEDKNLIEYIDLYQGKYSTKGIIRVKTWADLVAISNDIAVYKGYAIVVTQDIFIVSEASMGGVTNINFPENSVLDFNGFRIYSNGFTFSLQSPIPFNDDGLNFSKYPRIIYDRKIVPRPLYYSNNEDYTEPPLKGMWRVNDDKVYITDFHRGKRFNKAFSPFTKCEIIFAEDFTLSFGNNDSDSQGFYYGINSDVTLKCMPSVYIRFLDNNTNTTNNIYRIIGNNVKLIALNIGERGTFDQHIAFEISPKKHYGLCEYVVFLCSMRASVSTDVNTIAPLNEFKLNASYNKIWLRDTLPVISALNSGTPLTLRYNRGSVIENNTLDAGFYGLSMNFSKGVRIVNNTFNNIKWVPILVSGAVRLNMQNLSSNALTFENSDHYIAFNKTYFSGEEGISVDSVGGLLNSFTVASVVSNTITFNGSTLTVKNEITGAFFANDTDMLHYKNGAFLISLHKDRPMRYHRIKGVVSMGGDVYKIQCDFDSFQATQVGDRYTVAKVAYNNLIEQNEIHDAWTALCVYGNAIKNTFRGNVAFSTGMVAATWEMYMFSLKAETGGLSRAYYSPIIDNVFEGNTMNDEPSQIYGEHNGISITNKVIPEVNPMPLDPNITKYPNRGNKLINNFVRGIISTKGTIDVLVANNQCSGVSMIDYVNATINNPLPVNSPL